LKLHTRLDVREIASSASSFVVAFAKVDFSPLYVRFALIATELMRCSEMTRGAIRVLAHRNIKHC
jgi:hypothetical protein